MESITNYLDDFYKISFETFCLRHSIAGKDKDDLRKATSHLSAEETEKTWSSCYVQLLIDTYIQGKLI